MLAPLYEPEPGNTKMDIKNLVLSDAALEVIDSGVWVGDFDEAEGLELKVCGMQSQDVRKAMTAAQARARGANKGKPLNVEQLNVCTREVLADVVLKDWRGLTSEGKPVAYDKANSTEWLTSRNGERLAGMVLIAANRVDAEANEFVEIAAKN